MFDFIALMLPLGLINIMLIKYKHVGLYVITILLLTHRSATTSNQTTADR